MVLSVDVVVTAVVVDDAWVTKAGNIMSPLVARFFCLKILNLEVVVKISAVVVVIGRLVVIVVVVVGLEVVTNAGTIGACVVRSSLVGNLTPIS